MKKEKILLIALAVMVFSFTLTAAYSNGGDRTAGGAAAGDGAVFNFGFGDIYKADNFGFGYVCFEYDIFVNHAAGYTVSVPAGTFPAGQYSLYPAGAFDRFTNHVDGYSLLVPRGMTVDMSFSEAGAFLENENKRIEIYRHVIGPMARVDVYINYSKLFLQNRVDHFLNYRGWRVIGGHNVYVTSWYRDRLARVYNDRNHYVSLDINLGDHVYTIMVKANAPLHTLGGYEYLVRDFRREEEAAPGYVRRSRQVDIKNRGWNDATREFFIKHFHPDAPLTWGIFEPGAWMSNYSKLFEYEEFFGYTFPILLNYTEFENRYRHSDLRHRLDMARRHGRTLVLTLQTPFLAPLDGANHVYKILQGEYDRFLADYAQVIADFGYPVMFSLGNEMNGDWWPWSAIHTSKDTAIFREWYRYVFGFFERAGANVNTIWVWNPNGVSLPAFSWNHELMYYPGDMYVDVIGMTKYNTGTFFYHSHGETWQEFDELYEWLYHRYVAIYGQPLMIPEFASASMGGCKERWVINMFEAIQRYPMIKVAIWWDGADWDAYGNIARSYFIDETEELMYIFRHHLRVIPKRGLFGYSGFGFSGKL